MPVTPGGIEYQQLPNLSSGQPAYSETFVRDGNSMTAYLAVAWDDAEDFRAEIVGHTEYDPSAPYYLSRTLPLLCPYSDSAYAHSMQMVNYGRMPDRGTSVEDFDELVIAMNTANGVTNRNTAPAFFDDPVFDLWFTTHYAIYAVQFVRVPWIVVNNADLLAAYSATPVKGMELDRYVIRRRVNNVRELRTADYNFQPVGTSNAINVNGFIPTVEAEIIYTWYQVPFLNAPRTAINANRLKINSATFDNGKVFNTDGTTSTRPGYEPETMLFVDCRGLDMPPYQGADGGLYYDLDYVFRFKRNIAPDGTTVVGHQHFLNAVGEWVKVERRPPATAGTFLYQTSSTFVDMFTPQA